jgi:hypothetical protein
MNTNITTITKGKGGWALLACLALGIVLVLGLRAPAAATTAGDPYPAAGKSGPIMALVKILEVGRPVAYQALTIVPIYRTDSPRPGDFVMLDEAVKDGWIEIGELDGGRVPQVRISNLSKRTIYIMGGEILTGARQDRILAADLLLAPGTRNLVAPVYCVEHGRWTAVSPNFTTKNNIGTYDLRAKAAGKGDAAQAEIWSSVAEQNARVGVASPTSAYQDAYEAEGNKRKIQAIEEKMSAIPRLMRDTVGVVIALGGRIVSADIFADPSLFQKQWPKILRSSALSAIGHQGPGKLDQAAAADFLKKLVDRDYQDKKGLDLGIEYSCLDDDVTVQALALDNAVIHLASFAQDGGRKKVIETESPEQRIRVIRDETSLYNQAVISIR